MTKEESLVLLNMVEGVGSVRLTSLLSAFQGPQDIFSAGKDELCRVEGIGSCIAERIVAATKTIDYRAELALAEKRKVSVITLLDSAYPECLRKIPGAPLVLYVKGTLDIKDACCMAMVGSRRPSYYGLEQAERFAFQLASSGVSIVSGLARGIDTAAHQGALHAKGRTIAVLGSGLMDIYPPENQELAEDIARHGALVSEFPMRAAPAARNFPRRNRIISGLSRAVFVVEAARNSGALITADCALEQGREVFALPGKISERTSFGTNQLIKEGATPVTCVEDILDELPAGSACTQPSCQESLLQRISLSEQELVILGVLSNQPLSLEDIAHMTKLEVQAVGAVLTALELHRIVKQLPGKQFVLKEALLNVE